MKPLVVAGVEHDANNERDCRAMTVAAHPQEWGEFALVVEDGVSGNPDGAQTPALSQAG